MSKRREVHQYNSETGKYIKSFDSIIKAAISVGVDESQIRRACTGIIYGTGNYKWSYEKADSYYETNVLRVFAQARGIDPDEIVGARVTQTPSGKDRISIETRTNRIKDQPEIERETFQQKQKLLQRKQDELRVINKHFREYARIENSLTALNEALILLLSNQTFKPTTYQHPEREGTVLVVQVSDPHFNELVEMPDNQYGFVIGAKRMQRYAHTVHEMQRVYNASGIVVALTGDILNSDRRLDEKLHMATNRMKASLIATQILYHFLQDINRCANLKVIGVSGNESRVNEEFSMSEFAMSDNYDYLIFNMLKVLFKGRQGIEFIDGDPVEQVINVNNSNILITHGTGIKEGQAAMQQVFGKYAAKGILLDYAVFGHVHFANITDIYSRSGSIVGNNVYSDRFLNLVTKASQVIHIVERDGTISSLRVGLQYVDDYDGYDIKDDLTAYNSKLADNTKQRETIVQVII